MNLLFVSDLHLTAHPRDEYRWALFPWLSKQIVGQQISYLLILGDVTEAKDYHSARLVNRVVESLIGLYRDTGLLGIYILRGNHDGVDPKTAYFRFLGKYPSIQFVEVPYTCEIGGHSVLMLPHSREPVKEWRNVDMHTVDLILMHATVTGAVSETGMPLEGVPASALAAARRAKIYSGDVHVPQKVGRVEYVGAPYPVRFGDTYVPRAILLNTKAGAVSLPVPAPPAIQRRTIVVGQSGATTRSLAAEKLGKGDQVKVRVALAPAEFGDWPTAKRNTLSACAELGIALCGLELVRTDTEDTPEGPATVPVNTQTPKEVLEAWCTTSGTTQPRIVQVGTELLEG